MTHKLKKMVDEAAKDYHAQIIYGAVHDEITDAQHITAFKAGASFATSHARKEVIELMRNEVVESLSQDHFHLFSAHQIHWLEAKFLEMDEK